MSRVWLRNSYDASGKNDGLSSSHADILDDAKSDVRIFVYTATEDEFRRVSSPEGQAVARTDEHGWAAWKKQTVQGCAWGDCADPTTADGWDRNDDGATGSGFDGTVPGYAASVFHNTSEARKTAVYCDGRILLPHSRFDCTAGDTRDAPVGNAIRIVGRVFTEEHYLATEPTWNLVSGICGGSNVGVDDQPCV